MAWGEGEILEKTHVDLEVRVEQDLELVIRRARIPHHEARLEILGAQGHGVGQGEVVRPAGLAEHGVGEAEVELDGGIAAAVGQRRRLGRRFAEIFPAGGACESVLREAACRVVFAGRRAEYLNGKQVSLC